MPRRQLRRRRVVEILTSNHVHWFGVGRILITWNEDWPRVRNVSVKYTHNHMELSLPESMDAWKSH